MAVKPQITPVDFDVACEFVRRHHRHHSAPVGWKFGIAAVVPPDTLVGVAMVGRPVARHFDDGMTLEVTRCCTDGTPNVCSQLYGACRRAAFALGYRRLITYTLEREGGASLRGAGWVEVGRAGGGEWNCPSRPRKPAANPEQKTLWEAA